MPTYTVWAESGVVPASARRAIATRLTELHHEVAVAPRYLVQVIFTDLEKGGLFLSGEPAGEGHMWIRADIRSGRSDEQKRDLLERITVEVGAIAGVAPEHVWVYLCDIPGPSIAEYGRVLPHPGGEDEWFASLPEELQNQLLGRA